MNETPQDDRTRKAQDLVGGQSTQLSVVLGAGPVGRALTGQLVDRGHRVRVVTRRGTADVPHGVEVVAADLTSSAEAELACDGASTVYGCVGIEYSKWPDQWPQLMEGMLSGASRASARLVFMDNCYMYGPVDGPMHEDLPLTDHGSKPATRSRVTQQWLAAHDAGKVEVVAVRASDFYGPGVSMAVLGDLTFGRVLHGKSAQVLGDPDLPHSYTYVPDIARALLTLGDAPPSACGQAWNVPNAAPASTRTVLEAFADEVGQDLRVQATPPWLVAALGVIKPDLREVREMLYQWDRPFIVDSTKFEDTFWSDPTPLDEGVRTTAASYSR